MDRSQLLGIIGEHTLYESALDSGLTVRRLDEGADFELSYGKKSALIEVKNWANYYVTKQMFYSKIFSRFRTDPEHKKLWVVVINKRIAEQSTFKKLCKKHNIYVIPVEHHVTEKIKAIQILYEQIKLSIAYYLKKLYRGLFLAVLLSFLLRRVVKMMSELYCGGPYDVSGLKIAQFHVSESLSWFLVYNERKDAIRVVSFTPEVHRCTCERALYRSEVCRHIYFAMSFLELYDENILRHFMENWVRKVSFK